MNGYEVVIGLEVHTELSTKSKMFCFCPVDFNAPPNQNTCPVCTGMPGALPTANKTAVDFAIRAGLALNSDIAEMTDFDRKNYFYPDLPKAYQISQLYNPICKNGGLSILIDGTEKRIGIDNIHMEEDAGKLYHNSIDGSTLIDYNRGGIPLLEIVTNPDFRSGDEAVCFLEKLARIFRFIGISDCKIEEGSMRADVNLSVRKIGEHTLGTRTEMKNLSSFKSVKRACEYEAKRQIALLEEGKSVTFETRRFDEDKGITLSMRVKENADDYRYFHEPDIPPIIISREYVEKIKSELPQLPDEKYQHFTQDLKIPKGEADLILSSVRICNIFEQASNISNLPCTVSKFICKELFEFINKSGVDIDTHLVDPAKIARVAVLIDNGKINGNTANSVLKEIFENNTDPDEYIEKHQLFMISDEDVIRQRIIKTLEICADAVNDYKSGKDKAFGFIVGRVMAEFKGKADPLIINKILKELLNS